MNEINKKCEITDRDQRIDDFLLGKLSDKESEAFEIHVFGCPECFQELRIREQAVELIREERVTAVAKSAVQKSVAGKRAARSYVTGFFTNWQRKWVFAGVVAVAMVVILFMQIGQKDRAPDLLAEQFQENPQFESLLKQ
ncbi:MAG: zf-HC2 domain-containing protein, partial [bacterium]